MEFLMTYGWAIMTVLGVVGVLLFFNFLNPSLLLPDKCELGYRLSCDDFVLRKRLGFFSISNLMVTNSFPDEIVLTKINISASKYPSSYCLLSPASITLAQGNQTNIQINCVYLRDIAEGGKVNFDVTIDYYFQDAGPTYSYTLYGKIYTKLENS